MNLFITGTSSGIGNALAKTYLENGAIVFGLSRRANRKMEKYADFHHFKYDLGDIDHLGNELRCFLDQVDVLDQVILNAGLLPEINDIRETEMSEITQVMNVNVWANKVMLDTLFAHIPKIHQVVAISSGASLSGSRGWNVYAISKAALNMLIKLYSRELPGTHFAALAPGVVETGMQDYIYQLDDHESFAVVKRLKEMRDQNRMSDPAETALKLIEAMGLALQYESEEFLDIRDLLQI